MNTIHKVNDADTKTLTSRVIVDGAGFAATASVAKKMGATNAQATNAGFIGGLVMDVTNNMYSMDTKVINGIKKGSNAVVSYIKNEVERVKQAGIKATNMSRGRY